MRVAVVGDVHGHLALMYAILGRWQRESGETIDLILQVGDMGAFVESSTLDRATRRYAERDPEELGFAEFAGPSPPATLMDPRPPLLFIPGNHEDFDFLAERDAAADPEDAVYPVSEDGLISALRSGRVWTFRASDPRAGGREADRAASEASAGGTGEAEESAGLRIAGVSGVAGRERKRHLHPRLYLDEEAALGLAEAGPGAFDILISHDGPDGLWDFGARAGGGSPALRLLIDEIQPPLAFFGHYDRWAEWEIGPTRITALGGCAYVSRGEWPIKRYGIALVEWGDGRDRGATPGDAAGFAVERLSAEWLAESTRDSWRHWA